jgi:hypothetical protein
VMRTNGFSVSCGALGVNMIFVWEVYFNGGANSARHGLRVQALTADGVARAWHWW